MFTQNPMQKNQDDQKALYVGNLDDQLIEPVLYNAFMPYGHIRSLKIMKHLISKKSRGFGFINFLRAEDAMAAQEAMHNQVILQNQIKVYSKQRYNSLDKNANIFLSNLHDSIDTEKLEQICSEFGPVFSIKFLDYVPGEKKQAYVQFDKVEDSVKAISNLNGKEIEGNKICAEIATKSNVIFLKCRVSDEVDEKLKEIFEAWGVVTFGEKVYAENNQTFIVSVRMESKQKAKGFLQEFRAERINKDIIQDAIEFEKKNTMFKDFKKNAKDLYCRISPIKRHTSANKVAQEISTAFGSLKTNVLSESDGVLTLQVVFTKVDNLVNFISSLQNKNNIMTPYIDSENPKIEYPQFIIKLTMKNIKNKMEQNANMNSFAMGPMGQMPGFGPMPMPPMGQMNPMLNNGPALIPGMMPNMPPPHMNFGGPQTQFNTIKQIDKNMHQFQSLPREVQRNIFKDIIRQKLNQFPNVVNVNDHEQIEKICEDFTQDNLYDNEELVQMLQDNNSFQEVLTESLKEDNNQHDYELPVIQSVSFNDQKTDTQEIVDQQVQGLGGFRGQEKIRNNTSKLIVLTQLFQKVDQERILFRSIVLKMLKKKFWQIDVNSKSSKLFSEKVDGVQREIVQKQLQKLEKQIQTQQEEIEKLKQDKENLKNINKSLDDKLNEKNKEFRDFVLKKSESTMLHSTHESSGNFKDKNSGRFTQLRNTFTQDMGRQSESSMRTFKPRKTSQKKSFRSSFALKKKNEQEKGQPEEDIRMRGEYEPISDQNPRQQTLLRKLSQRKFARKFNN